MAKFAFFFGASPKFWMQVHTDINTLELSIDEGEQCEQLYCQHYDCSNIAATRTETRTGETLRACREHLTTVRLYLSLKYGAVRTARI
jgi:hypothetical protein